ncbi:hypothetical protein FJY63_11865, partial [Candidatus Sumerlaeota bacterium]|nr:hypothetical protein [Candidatus Sumerlaeota bacterium]
MCHSHESRSCIHRLAISRRDFVAGCGAMLVIGGRGSAAPSGEKPTRRRVRVGLVFLSKKGASWPYPE